MRLLKYLLFCLVLANVQIAAAQTKKPVYHPCFLLDSVDARLDFIKLNAARIFTDTIDCKQTLLDSISIKYLRTKDKKYLDALATIRQNPMAKVENEYPDLLQRIIKNDFVGFINQLYAARGKYLPLEKELVASLSMIIDGRPLKQKYIPQINTEIDIARMAKDAAKMQYLMKLKVHIETESY